MKQTNFVDYIRIFCRSGNGGAGSEHFRREKFIPKGGPDGGDGGRGGHIYLRGNQNQWTLLHLRYKKHIFADNGEPGGGSRSSGSQGEDIFIDTIARNEETNEVICEVTKHDEVVLLQEGGMGGLGNYHFKTSTNQTPRYAQPGRTGEESWYIFELKVLADIGLVGFPNAGKSTLLSVISAAKPKIANYPFTTLVPNLGIVPYRDNRSFVVADIPGIIEGASEGKGLGLRFLRHIERNSALLFMVPADSDDIHKEYSILLNELELHNPQLLDKSRILAITKSDLLDDELIAEIEEDLPSIPHMFISSVAQLNLEKLKDLLWNTLNDKDDA
jgi:GTP-binding protein